MLHTRFTGLIFGLLFVLHALQSCSVHGHQGGETIGEKHVGSEEIAVVAKEFVDGLGGRKMGGHEVKEIGEKQGLEVRASKNSGESTNAEIFSTEKFEDQANNQVSDMNKLQSKTRDLAGPRNDHQPFHLENSMQFEKSKAVPPKASLESHSSSSDHKAMTEEPLVTGNGVESKKLLEAAKEIVNLMNKDYTGSNRPRRKPPINNQMPRH